MNAGETPGDLWADMLGHHRLLIMEGIRDDTLALSPLSHAEVLFGIRTYRRLDDLVLFSPSGISDLVARLRGKKQ